MRRSLITVSLVTRRLDESVRVSAAGKISGGLVSLAARF